MSGWPFIEARAQDTAEFIDAVMRMRRAAIADQMERELRTLLAAHGTTPHPRGME